LGDIGLLDNVLKGFMDMREDSISKILAAQKRGQKIVGVYCTYCPKELIIAAGAIPVGLCGTREEPIPAAEAILPRNLCPLIKSSFGFAVTDTCPFFHLSDLVVGETTCDGKRKMFELLQELKPVHVMQLPHQQRDEASFSFWLEELRRLKTRLEEEIGTEISDDKIRNAITIVKREKEALKALFDLSRKDPPPFSGMELLTISWLKGFSSDAEIFYSMLEELVEVAHHRKVQSGKGKPRVLLTGCPVGLGSEKIVRLIEELGGIVVAMENCSSYKTLELQVEDNGDDPLLSLAQAYLKIPCSCMSPNPYRLELLSRMIDDFKVQAVVDLTWQACHTYNIEAGAVQKMVKGIGLPYMHLETDYSSSDDGHIKVRLEAMLEIVS